MRQHDPCVGRRKLGHPGSSSVSMVQSHPRRSRRDRVSPACPISYQAFPSRLRPTTESAIWRSSSRASRRRRTLPHELVACDDGSTDGTVAVLEEFARSAPFRVRVVRNERRLGYADNFLTAAAMCDRRSDRVLRPGRPLARAEARAVCRRGGAHGSRRSSPTRAPMRTRSCGPPAGFCPTPAAAGSSGRSGPTVVGLVGLRDGLPTQAPPGRRSVPPRRVPVPAARQPTRPRRLDLVPRLLARLGRLRAGPAGAAPPPSAHGHADRRPTRPASTSRSTHDASWHRERYGLLSSPGARAHHLLA